MAPEPPEVVPIGPGHQLARLVHLGEGCTMSGRYLSTLRSATDGRPPVIQLGASRSVAPDALFALLCEIPSYGDLRGGPAPAGRLRLRSPLSSGPARRRLAAVLTTSSKSKAGLV